jgi:hypothetical protein
MRDACVVLAKIYMHYLLRDFFPSSGNSDSALPEEDEAKVVRPISPRLRLLLTRAMFCKILPRTSPSGQVIGPVQQAPGAERFCHVAGHWLTLLPPSNPALRLAVLALMGCLQCSSAGLGKAKNRVQSRRS